MEALKTRRKSIKDQLTNFNKYIRTFEDSGNMQELKLRLEKIEEQWASFDVVQTEIEILDEKEGKFRHSQFEEPFFQAVGAARKIINDHQQQDLLNASASGGNAIKVKLPAINLPTFNGSYTEWLMFSDAFLSIIDQNEGLTRVQKFQYLRGSLRNEALQVIQALETTDDNYEVAWAILKNRYENKQLIINTHLKNLFEITAVLKESATNLRQFIDTIRTNISALKTLKEPVDQWSTMLIYLFNSKLDWRTRQLWQEKLSNTGDNQQPTLTMFLDFLSNRSQALEMSERTIKTETNTKVWPIKKNLTFAATKGHKCEYCQQEHYLFKCEKFLKLTPTQRFEEIRKMRLCANCLKFGHLKQDCRSPLSCKKCHKRHNTLLHKPQEEHQTEQGIDHQAADKQQSSSLVSNAAYQGDNHVFLPTAVVLIYDKQGNMHQARVLLDSGSQSNFITKHMVQKLNLPCNKLEMEIFGINNKLTNIHKQATVKIKSRFNGFTTTMKCLVLDKITDKVPQINISKQRFNLPDDINLADEKFNISSPIDLLIGSEIFWQILSTGQIMIAKDKPVLQKTVFGWLVTGVLSSTTYAAVQVSCLSLNNTLEHQLERFWKIEETPDIRNWTEEEHCCEEHFKQTFSRNEEGRFIVSLPKRPNFQLGESYGSALTRFKYLERRLHYNMELQQDYIKFMQQYQDMGHMTQIENNTDTIHSQTFYLPHHPVIKQESLTTKTRVVFDGSHKTNTGRSLNDELLVGPVIQDELFHIILRFRIHHYVLTADIAMMYRQILIKEEDRHLQRILWRKEPEDDIQIFTLNTVTYGTSAAPYLATRCLKQLAEDDGDQYELAREAVLNDFYMDDVVTGTNTLEEAIKLQQQLDELLKRGKFVLRKWRANNPDILKRLTTEDHTTALLVLNNDEIIKILGLLWNASTDNIHLRIKCLDNDKITKRSILSQIVQIFDPLGLIGPVTIKAKGIMQSLWKLQLHWDEGVPQHLHTEWLHYSASLQELNRIQIPRNVNINNVNQYIDIHGFCDASEKAYGACIYVSSKDQHGNRNTQLLCAKARVAPLKTISLPRLELCGATLLANLVSVVEQALRDKIQNIYLWCDSTIVLSWINTDPHLLKIFVANRVTEIKRLTCYFKWYHVKSAENPADVISRGETAADLTSNKLWWNGPQWLQQAQWPEQEWYEESTLERKVHVTLTAQKKPFSILTKYSSWIKLLRILGYCLRWRHNSQTKNRQSRIKGELTVEELNAAKDIIIHQVQEEAYAQEIQDLKRNNHVSSKSKLISLHPYLDERQLIRVGGRIQNAEVSQDQKHPLILPAKHHITNLIFAYEHKRAHHCGPEQLLAIVRTQFWPIAGRQGAKQVTRNCFDCFRYQPKKTEHIMGNLPAQRVCGNNRPFTICGIDYAGPIQLREHKRRGRLYLTKAYFAIFVCFSTKAVHLELVSDLTAEAFLAALRRFVARRGLCKEIHSDNATNFVGANRQLIDVYKFLQQNTDQIKQELATKQIKWVFLPPRSPHMGGLWEAAVKATKRHFMKVTKGNILTYEECYTLLCEIESILNSRPLLPLSSSPNDYNPLTPAHFLIGDTLLTPPDNSYPYLPDNKLTRWQHIQRLKQHFWNRWHKEYLHQLQQRTKWTRSSPNIMEGTLVVLLEDNVPPLRWPMGRIIQTYPGEDGVVRVVLVRTSHGTYKRPVTKVCVVPSESDRDPN